MMRIIATPLICVVLSLPTLAADTGKTVSLFNGKNLDNWTVIACDAAVEDKAILLKEGNGSSLAYAGGTDLLVDIRSGLREPKLLVDIKGIDGLDHL